MEERKCAYCGKTFKTHDHRLKYCTIECRKEASKRYNSTYIKNRRKIDEAFRLNGNASNLRSYYRRRESRAREECMLHAKIIMDFAEKGEEKAVFNYLLTTFYNKKGDQDGR